MIVSTEQAIKDFKEGKFLIVVDDESRENEGDLIIPAELVTPEKVNFMARYGRGLVCVALEGKRCEELGLDLMVGKNSSLHNTAFTVSIDARENTTTGISAQDRSVTIQKMVDDAAVPEDFCKPGHIFPLRSAEGGVLKRAGHTEAAVDLARLAGYKAAGVLCEILNEDGSMARVPDLEKFAQQHGLNIVMIKDLIRLRCSDEKIVRRLVKVKFPTAYGEFDLIHFSNEITGEHHLALVKGDVKGEEPILVRVHSSCLTGDVFGSARCDCGDQLHSAMMQIEKEGKGIILYMNQEGRGIGLHNKLLAYKLQEEGLDTVEANHHLGFPADLREYGTGALMLKNLGVKRIKLLTNNPRKVIALSGFDLTIVERVPLQIQANAVNLKYLTTKRDKLGHYLSELNTVPSENGTN